MAAVLADTDVGALSGYDRIVVLRAHQRLVSHYQAQVYADMAAMLADRGLVVVRHGSDVRSADELRHQLDLVGAPLLGYVYNAAPLRTEMTVRMGSTAVPVDAESVPPTTT